MELIYFLIEGVVTLYICLVFAIVGNSAFEKNWNNCPLQSDALRLLPVVSLKECRNQCHIRNHCKLICYRTRTKLCEIHGDNADIKPCKRCVSVLPEQLGIPSSCTQCLDGKTCNTATGLCEYTECPESIFPFSKTQGNLAYVGAKKLSQCLDSSDVYNITCIDTGEWINVPICEDICPSTTGIITLADDFHVMFCNLAVTQPVAHAYCDTLGGALIKMDEPYKIQAIVQTIYTIAGLYPFDYWVDGFSEHAEDVSGWKYSDGTQMLMDKIFWANWAPNGEGPQCVRLSNYANHLLDDRECDRLFHYACKMH